MLVNIYNSIVNFFLFYVESFQLTERMDMLVLKWYKYIKEVEKCRKTMITKMKSEFLCKL